MHRCCLLLVLAITLRAAEPPGTAAPDYHAPHADIPAGFAIRHPIDGAEMVWVPAGWFRMGLDRATAQRQAESLGYTDYHEIAGEESFPERMVHVQGFYIDRCEVTFARWKRFVDATGWKPTSSPPTWIGPELKEAEAQLPIASVTWQAAQEYANWARKQLPTEAMWEKAARGTDGRWYPWGDEPPTRELGVISMTDALPGPEPVGSCPKGASPYGCLDMAGNVYEWTSEWKEPYPNNPEVTGEWGHRFVALRGGSFYHTRHSYRTAKRMGFTADETYFHVGLRTAWYPPDDFDHRAHAVP
jgi:formylglycine-generating enzyme required for sulfatase activity